MDKMYSSLINSLDSFCKINSEIFVFKGYLLMEQKRDNTCFIKFKGRISIGGPERLRAICIDKELVYEICCYFVH